MRAITVLFWLTALSARGATWYVAAAGSDSDGRGSRKSPLRTIQYAMDRAIDGDTVVVSPGTYRGPGNADLTFRGKAITRTPTEMGSPI